MLRKLFPNATKENMAALMAREFSQHDYPQPVAGTAIYVCIQHTFVFDVIRANTRDYEQHIVWEHQNFQVDVNRANTRDHEQHGVLWDDRDFQVVAPIHGRQLSKIS
jgi:hypothetical protein